MPNFRLFDESVIIDPANSAPSGWTAGTFASAVNLARTNKRPLRVRPGLYDVANLDILSSNGNGNTISIFGSPGSSILRFTGGNYCLRMQDVNNIVISGISFNGQNLAIPAYAEPNATTEPATGLLIINNCKDFIVENCTFTNTLKAQGEFSKSYKAQLLICNASIGIVTKSSFTNGDTAIWNFRSRTNINENAVENFQSNGILIYDIGMGGNNSVIRGNFINNIDAPFGNGQTGNCIVAYRSSYVKIIDNSCVNAKYSGIRCNAAPRAMISRNSVYGTRECAIFAEAPGAGQDMVGSIISENSVEACGDGIKVANSGYFNDGIARLSVVKGNLVTGLVRNSIPAIPTAPASVTGAEGIAVEQDCVVEANIIDNCFIGAKLGVAQGARDINFDGNIVRNCPSGIVFSSNSAASNVCITNNDIRNTSGGAIISTPSLGASPVTATYNANNLAPQTAGTGGTVLIAGNRAA